MNIIFLIFNGAVEAVKVRCSRLDPFLPISKLIPRNSRPSLHIRVHLIITCFLSKVKVQINRLVQVYLCILYRIDSLKNRHLSPIITLTLSKNMLTTISITYASCYASYIDFIWIFHLRMFAAAFIVFYECRSTLRFPPSTKFLY